MKIISEKIKLDEIKQMTEKMFGNFVKAVVDVQQENLWGINLYPEFFNTDDFVEFDSMINLRPNQNNRSRSVEDQTIQQKIKEIINKLIQE